MFSLIVIFIISIFISKIISKQKKSIRYLYILILLILFLGTLFFTFVSIENSENMTFDETYIFEEHEYAQFIIFCEIVIFIIFVIDLIIVKKNN